jgi:hypothetical protein
VLPVKSWRVLYADGSAFSSEDGTWAEAPPFGVQCVVCYHVPDPAKLQRITKDGGSDNGDVYVWPGEETGPEYEGIKMGLWTDGESYYRVADLASRRTVPEV